MEEIGCQHYQRKCLLVAPCCGEIFWCRHCHNAAKFDDAQDGGLKHVIDRKAVTEVVCAVCRLRQEVRQDCLRCGTVFGQYFCPECKFFDDDTSKLQFHCNQCGICRVGGRQNFFHCNTCNCCYHVDMQNSHVCHSNSMHKNCPICQEFLFDSIREIMVLSCGHTIHISCFKILKDQTSIHKCPVCSCSIGNMATQWRQMDMMIAASPMPRNRQKLVLILCNDCKKTCVVKSHVIGHKCESCSGYNTVVLRPYKS